MRVGLYASDKNLEAGAFRSGLLACGHRPIWRSHSDYKHGQVEGFDAVLVTGLRSQGDWIRSDYEAQGIPCIVIDYGYLRRTSGKATWETGHWQVGVGGLNRPPSFECPRDRFDALGVEIKSRAAGKGRRPLVLGQHVGDPSHGTTAAEMRSWAQWLCDALGAMWRPHPDSPDLGVDADRADGPLLDVLARASVVHTLCSTAGLDALLAGVPAVAYMPGRASWGGLSGPKLPALCDRKALCQRLAYGQWTLDEMRSGLAAEFVMNNVGIWNA